MSEELNIDLEGLMGRFGRKLAQAELEAEVATQRAQRLEARVAELEESIRNGANDER